MDFDRETKRIISGLEMANGYMDCEMVISSNINQYHFNGVSDSNIEVHLTQLRKHLNELIAVSGDPYDCMRYRYVTHIMDTGRLRQLISKSK